MPRVQANGIELEYVTHGDPGDPPLVLIMGLGAQLVFWHEGFCDALAHAGFYVIRFDNRDVGLSSHIEGKRHVPIAKAIRASLLGKRFEAAYTLLDMADDVAGLLDALEIESAHIAGASLGGMIAQTFALLHPHRIRSLTSIMSHTGERRWLLSSPRTMLGLLKKPPSDRSGYIDHQTAFIEQIGGTLPIDMASVRERVALSYDRGFYPPGVQRQMVAALASGSRKEALRYVRTPSLVIHGSADPLLTVGGGRATAEALPNAKLLIIEGMGHALPRAAWPDMIAGMTQLA